MSLSRCKLLLFLYKCIFRIEIDFFKTDHQMSNFFNKKPLYFEIETQVKYRIR